MTTPIDSLPNELLEKIFKAGAFNILQMDAKYPQRPLFSKLPSPPLFTLSVSHVSSRWRGLTLQIPRLWCQLHLSRSVDAHRRLKLQVGRSLDWVPLYLERSKNIPLSVVFDSLRLPREAATRIISLCSNRWRSLIILVSHVGTLPMVLSAFVQCPTPELRSLMVASDIYREGIVAYEPMPAFLTHPTTQLSSVYLYGVYVNWTAPPLSNLTHLELRYATRWPNFEQLRSMFDSFPSLETLVVQDDIPTLLRNVDRHASLPPIDLPILRALEIIAHRIRDAEADIASLLAIFSMPLLKTLTLANIKPSEWFDVSQSCGLPEDPTDFLRSSGTNGPHAFPLLASLTVLEPTTVSVPAQVADAELGNNQSHTFPFFLASPFE